MPDPVVRLVLLWSLVLVPSLVRAQDVVTLRSGDRLSGRIKSITEGVMIFTVPVIDGDLNIDWNGIASVQSQATFQILTTSGERFLARIRSGAVSEGEIVIETTAGPVTLSSGDIVYLQETSAGLPGFLNATAGAGISVARSNDQKQFNATANVGYETIRFDAAASLNSIFATQTEGQDTNRHEATFRFTWNVAPRWGATVVNTLLTSRQQELDLRSVLGGGPNYQLYRSPRTSLVLLVGAVWNSEDFGPGAATASNDEVEALAALSFSYFQFKQWNLTSTFSALPSLSTSGRVRANLNANVRFRLVPGKSIHWNLSQIVDLDSQPPSGASGTDYVTTTSISWEFP